MNEGRTIFSQVMEHAPHHDFRRNVGYRGDQGGSAVPLPGPVPLHGLRRAYLP